MTEIVLTCINTLRNRGVEALLLSIVQGLEETIQNPKITLLTRDVDGAKDSLSRFNALNVNIIPDSAWSPPVDASALTKLKFKLKRLLRMGVFNKLTPAEAALAKADLVIASGGDVFSSDYDIMERYLRQYDQVIAANKPLMFLGQSIGPFKTQAEISSFSNIAKDSYLTVRETISQKYLLETLKLPEERVSLVADPAFLLAVPEELKTEMLARYGCERGNFAAAAVSQGISLFKGLDHAEHVQAWVNAAHTMLETWPRIVLIPHVQLPHAEEDDLSLARDIKAAMNDDSRVVIMEELHTSIEFKSMLSTSAFVVAERTHAAIGAMSSGVPTLSIGYSIKAEGVLRQLVPNDDLFNKLITPAPEFTSQKASEITSCAMAVRDDMAQSLNTNLPLVKERARENFVIAARLCEK